MTDPRIQIVRAFDREHQDFLTDEQIAELLTKLDSARPEPPKCKVCNGTGGDGGQAPNGMWEFTCDACRGTGKQEPTPHPVEPSEVVERVAEAIFVELVKLDYWTIDAAAMLCARKYAECAIQAMGEATRTGEALAMARSIECDISREAHASDGLPRLDVTLARARALVAFLETSATEVKNG